jgi:8-oxo-dGTP pyrophosphatase MutT (NUDIX family)
MIFHEVRRRAFWGVSRLCFFTYRHFPVFGTLRASVAVIQQGQQYLAIRRNDARGYSFPGGLAMPWESEEQTLKREVAEETGLELRAAELALRYHSAFEISCDIAVFRVKVTGHLRGSWEGDPVWVSISDLRSSLVPSQLPIIEKVVSADRT